MRRARLLVSLLLLASSVATMPLRAEAGSPLLRAEGGKLLDGDGRDVLLRGIAVINKYPPFLPPVASSDFARIRSWGMNSIRLGTSWAAIEPEKGTYDQEYLSKFTALVSEATGAGLYVVVDMHQDVYGTPWDNGAPAWAAETTCPHADLAGATGAWAANYLSPAVMCAFTSFWTSADLQAHYAGAWVAVAARLKDNPMVAGYDLMNEPYQGFIPPGVFETQYLYPSQARWLDAIRGTGDGHVGFLEPPNYKNVHMPTVPPLEPPENAVYAPHLYGLWDWAPYTGAEARPPLAETNFRYSVAEAGVAGLPLWLGEFGMVYDAPDAEGFLRRVYDLADEARAGASYWVYEPGTGYSPIEKNGTPRGILDDIARAYPAAVPGLTAFHFDAATSELTATWSGGGTAIFAAPEIRYPNGPDVGTDGQWTWDRSTGELRVTGGSTVLVRPA
ncbi:MAG: cellulase family glycosylhydrolase [Acidobacteria bacterium]|nr:cellulase family glycosylhydrolase [Acidobacteriota bacterium]